MSAHPPPVPPDQRPPHGTGDASGTRGATAAAEHAHPPRDPNTAEQGRQGNTKQNTTNKGYQQDR